MRSWLAASTMVAILGASSLVLARGTVHMLPIVDGAAAEVGEGCAMSYGALRDYLVQVRGGGLNIVIYEPDQAPGPAAILSFFTRKYDLDGKPIPDPDGAPAFGPDDLVWFYYCGHGATDPLKGHILKMTQGDLVRSLLRQTMEALKVRAVLITSDACATPGKLENLRFIAGARPGPEIDHRRVLLSLLGEAEGTIDINAARLNESAFVSPELGANFTNALHSVLSMSFDALNLNSDEKVDWEEAFTLVRSETQNNFSELKTQFGLASWQVAHPQDKNQIPYAFSLGKKSELFGNNDQAISVVPYAGSFPLETWKDKTGMRGGFLVRANGLNGHRLSISAQLQGDRGQPTAIRVGGAFDRNGRISREFAVTQDSLVFGPNNPVEFWLPIQEFVKPPNKQPLLVSVVAIEISDLSTGQGVYAASHVFGEPITIVRTPDRNQ